MKSETKIGNYLLERLVGRGGMGVVYKGRHTTLPREVAIKSVSARGAARHDLRRLRHRFEREAYIQSQLDHPSIVKIYDYIVSEQTYYIVMEYVEGRSLAEVLEGQAGAPLEVERTLDLFEQILSAVSFAHSFVYRDEEGVARRGIIHRDLKPANIMVTAGDQIKITDFGIVKLVGAETSDTSGIIYGSPHYVSPEQAAGLALDQRSDIYSLGVILYEMLTGEPPFGGPSQPLSRTEILRAHVEQTPRPPSSLNPEVSRELQRVVCRALEKKPERRFAAVSDFLRAVRAARGRDTDDLPEQQAEDSDSQLTSKSRSLHAEGGATERTTAPSMRAVYDTQPLRPAVCGACGTEAEADESYCHACGHDLQASPATANLKRRELSERRRTRGVLVASGLCTLALVGGVVIYSMRSGRDERQTPENVSSTQPAPSAPQPGLSQLPANLVELRPERVRVDSSFEGYRIEPLTDRITDVRRIASMRYNSGNWASAETPLPHWIELEFARPVSLSAVYIYWGFDRGRYVPSRRIELQTPTADGNWQTISTLEPGEDYDRAAFEFSSIEARRIRIFQPAQQGPKGRPFVMWVREVQVYGVEPDEKATNPQAPRQ